jgi:hypothetical protein
MLLLCPGPIIALALEDIAGKTFSYIVCSTGGLVLLLLYIQRVVDFYPNLAEAAQKRALFLIGLYIMGLIFLVIYPRL